MNYFTFINSKIQLTIKHKPPIGVKGIMQYFIKVMSPRNPLLIAKTYKDPENIKIPISIILRDHFNFISGLMPEIRAMIRIPIE